MNHKSTSILVTTVLLAFSLSAQALTLQFNAGLNGANETTPTGSTATGIATLFYDDNNTAFTTDDSYNFSLSAFGLSGLVSGMHIHAPAAPGFNGPVVVPLTSPNFLVFNSGSSILIGGAGIAPPSSVFLSQLQAGLAYANLHTALYPGGEIRGQLVQVAVVPEPSTYAMLLTGLGLIGVFVSRRTKVS